MYLPMRLLQLDEVVLTDIHKLVELTVGVVEDRQLEVSVPDGDSVELLLYLP